MATSTTADEIQTLDELLQNLGRIALGRVRVRPPLGTATEADLIATNERKQGICELVDGVLVEKAMGLLESLLAGALIAYLRAYVIPRNLGIVTTPDGMLRLAPGIVRAPDVAFIAWGRISGGKLSSEAIGSFAPDLAVEILSRGNTKAEMARKRREYFAAGVHLVWEVDPVSRTVAVFHSSEEFTLLDETETLDGGAVLPGFVLSLGDLFSDLDRQGGV